MKLFFFIISVVYFLSIGFVYGTDKRFRKYNYFLNSKDLPFNFNNTTQGTPIIMFSSILKEGNYKVTIIVKSSNESNGYVSVKVENRRLMVLNHNISHKSFDTLVFLVHVRDSLIHNENSYVQLKPREHVYRHWDNKLTMEIIGMHVLVCGITIDTLERQVPIIFLAGNSTVVDQPEEPYAAWGQMLPAMLRSDSVLVANYAESGETIRAFVRERRLEKIFSLAKKGDYLFIEFAHNDQKSGTNHLDPFTSYQDSLKSWIIQCRKRGIIPVLITSTSRRSFDSIGIVINTLGDYPAAMRKIANEMNVALIDLNIKTRDMYTSWGPEASKKAFVHFPAHTFPNQEVAWKDDTHFTNFGAYEVARCVAGTLANSPLEIARFVLPQFAQFDQNKPDRFENIQLPTSALTNTQKPDGN